MEDNKEVNGTEQTSPVENNAEKQENQKEMAEENSVNETPKKVAGDVADDVENNATKAPEDEKETVSNDENKSITDEVPIIKDEIKVEEEELVDSDLTKEVKEHIIEKPEDTAVKTTAKENKQESPKDKLAEIDFSTYDKAQFVDLIKVLAKHDNPLYAERYLKQIEPLFNTIKKAELAEAKEAYIKENGNDEGFDFRGDELTNRFEANTRLIHDHKQSFNKDRDAQRQANLKKAEEALEKLRVFVGSEESSVGFNKFKEIQNEWKSIGDVPGNQSKTLWANYNALVNRFYDQRSIYFELKELDRKKNYEAKVNICERAEALANFENLKEAINSLNDLHYEYKHLGPVPKILQEDLWQRFKAASDKVYEKRKEFVSDLKIVLQENLVKKKVIVETIKPFVDFNSDRIKEWNVKTKELLAIQKEWESIGGLPRDKTKEFNKVFWSSFKTFFHNKGNFFKKLDADRKSNYDAKQVLVDKAEALKENTDWLKTANDFKALQQEWKTIGPVPEKFRNQLYDKFKAACDSFFDTKRAQSKDDEKSYKENLKIKKEIIIQIQEWAVKADEHIEEFKLKTKEFLAVGFVPRKEIETIKDNFSMAIDGFIKALTSEDDSKNILRMEIEFGNILGSKNAEKAIYGKEQNIRRQVQQLENDIALWKNNLEFFAHSKSKNADDLRKDVNSKIEKSETKVGALKGQLKVLRGL